MPSRRHDALAWAIPRLRGSGELTSVEDERTQVTRCHSRLEPGLPTRLVPRFERRYTLVTERLSGPSGDFPSYVLAPRGVAPSSTVYVVHGGGFVSPIDPVHVRYAARLASALGARVVVPAYPLAPEHTWRDSHDALVTDLARRTALGPVTLVGDSAGGGLALGLALSLLERGAALPTSLVLHSPWVDLTTSTPETAALAEVDRWLHLSKLHVYAEWWAGQPEDLGRPEVSPALADHADLARLPRTLMFCGTRDLLLPGCRLLANRAAGTAWDLTYVEEPDLIHVYPLLPFLPEAARAWRTTLDFLRAPA